MRNKRSKAFCAFANMLKEQSKCTDRKVAAIITDKDLTTVYSIGINGGPKRGIDCLCCLGGKYTCVHAEVNAIAKCNVPDKDKVMFTTFGPCITCASLIVNSGFSAVVILESYKDPAGLTILRDADIRVYTIEDWHTIGEEASYD